jgi:hypothetical protein
MNRPGKPLPSSAKFTLIARKETGLADCDDAPGFSTTRRRTFSLVNALIFGDN